VRSISATNILTFLKKDNAFSFLNDQQNLQMQLDSLAKKQEFKDFANEISTSQRAKTIRAH
jgi:hypothetical protein